MALPGTTTPRQLRQPRAGAVAIVLLLVIPLLAWPQAPVDTPAQRLIMGSFQDNGKAQRWAQQVAQTLEVHTQVLTHQTSQGQWYRVATQLLQPSQLRQTKAQAKALGWQSWVLGQPAAVGNAAAASPRAFVAIPVNSPLPLATPAASATRQEAPATRLPTSPSSPPLSPSVQQDFDIDLALESRAYAHEGLADQARWHPSSSLSLRWHRSWNGGQRSFTATPFFRYDLEDDKRTHADLRDLYLSFVGNDWELHAGVRRVFWGVTEFHHLVDVINQTDLVENIDAEDKLGQPMVQLSLVRDWGIVDLFALTGFRERTFPGADGRLRALLPINEGRATYASGAGQHRTDAALRYSHQLGGVDFGVYHFSGTNRDPQLRVVGDGNGGFELRPHYVTIDQTGLDAQANWGDWAFKLEAITRSGDGGRYAAANVGVERTLVGALGSRIDLGLVLEYLFDERGLEATNTVFEQDVALGLRWQFNDLADSEALMGMIWDTDTHELVTSFEGSRRFGDYWLLRMEARFFSGASDPRDAALLGLLADSSQKTAPLQRDDFLQLEFTRYF